MQNPIKVVVIDGISYPIIHDEFFNARLPHVACSRCKYAVCAICCDSFSLNHECKINRFTTTLPKNHMCQSCKETIRNELKIKYKNKNI